MRITDEGRNIVVEIAKDDHNKDLSRAIIYIADKLNQGYTLGTFYETNDDRYAAVLDGRDQFDALTG